jgi:hypothetical protein
MSEGRGETEVCELREMELSEGDRRFAFGLCGGGTAGDSDLPLPRTLPPPRALLDII